MNENYIKSVINDREREIIKIVEDNRTKRDFKDSARTHLESGEQDKNVLIFWFLVFTKWFKSVFAVNPRTV
jgi:hypothetical protein